MNQRIEHNQSSFALSVCELGVKNQRLMSRCLDHGLIAQARELKQLDTQLVYLLHKAGAFDFVGAIADGKTLLVGESNLSFTHSLTTKKRIMPSLLTATTLEAANNLSSLAAENAEKLRSIGVRVLHGIDATRLASTFGADRFDNIIFQFPHTGSWEPVSGHNSNFILVRDFLKSALKQLALGGKVLITAVDNPHYRGAFQFEEAARIAGFKESESYLFDPSDFPRYAHTMTHEDDGALGHHNTFSTWVFKR